MRPTTIQLEMLFYQEHLSTGPMPPIFADAYPDDIQPPSFDLAKAKEFMNSSSYAGKGQFDIEVMYVAGLAFEEKLVFFLKSVLDTIGFNTILKPEPWNRMTELAGCKYNTSNKSGILRSHISIARYILFTQYHSRAKGTWASMEWLFK